MTDGIVLAADSAASFFLPRAAAPIKIYNHANKIVNLVKGMPIGAMIYGSRSIGASSVETLSKDLRARLSDRNNPDYGLDPDNYTVQEVAGKARKFLYEESYLTAYNGPPPNFLMGYRVCGYSAKASLSEVWEFLIDGANCQPPHEIQAQDEFGMRWAGENEALDRLLFGVSGKIKSWLLSKNFVPASNVDNIYFEIINHCNEQILMSAMPIQDAIEVARFSVETASKFAKFGIRPETIGGPIEIAAITKHEGFKWVCRKHYFTTELNPGAGYER